MLLALGSGNAGVAMLKSRVAPLLRRGWVTADDHATAPRYHGFTRITPDGLRALAVAVEKYGLPELGSTMLDQKVCSDCGAAPFRAVCKSCGGNLYHYEAKTVEEALDAVA
jgi:hypothetical protein